MGVDSVERVLDAGRPIEEGDAVAADTFEFPEGHGPPRRRFVSTERAARPAESAAMASVGREQHATKRVAFQ